MVLYYSACGNSRFVAECLSTALGEELKSIPELLDQGSLLVRCKDQMLGFVFPVYGWDVPRIVYDFLGKMDTDGRPSYVWFACTCGDNIGNTCDRFKSALQARGLFLDSAYTFKMPETYLCFPGFKLDSEEGESAKIAAVREKLPKVAESIRSREKVQDLIKGGWPSFKTNVIGTLFKLAVSDSAFRAGSGCIGCGLCAKVCQYHNILMKKGSDGRLFPEWTGHCSQCMACYHYCPVNAIHYGNFTKGKGQYHFPAELSYRDVKEVKVKK